MRNFVEITKVKCMGRHHRIGLTSKGRLSLLDHQENEEALQSLLVFNPEQRCRCTEIKKIWNWYIEEKGGIGVHWYDIARDHVWVEEAFKQKDRSYFEPPSPSRVLGMIPKPLRPYLLEAAAKRLARRRTYSGFNSYSPPARKEGHYLQLKASPSLKREALHRARQRRVCRALGTSNLQGVQVSFSSPVWNFQGEDWFKSVESVGLFPCDVPPVELWNDVFPPWLKAIGKSEKKDRFSGRHLVSAHWVKIRFLEGTPDLPPQYTVVRSALGQPQ